MSHLTFAIGDIHGCLNELGRLQLQCEAYAAEQGCVDPLYIYLGDYIDRGPASAQVLENLRQFAENHRAVFLMGNHEKMLIDAILEGRGGVDWVENGGGSTILSFGYGHHIRRATPAAIDAVIGDMRRDPAMVIEAEYLDAMPTSYQDSLRYYVHAGIRPNVPLVKQNAHDKIWIREPFLEHEQPFEKFVVHGHTPNANGEPDLRSNRVNLDTMAFRTGILTAAVFNDEQANPVSFIQARPIQESQP